MWEAVTGHPKGDPYTWNYLHYCSDPQGITGMSIDTVRSYLDELLGLQNVIMAEELGKGPATATAAVASAVI